MLTGFDGMHVIIISWPILDHWDGREWSEETQQLPIHWNTEDSKMVGRGRGTY